MTKLVRNTQEARLCPYQPPYIDHFLARYKILEDYKMYAENYQSVRDSVLSKFSAFQSLCTFSFFLDCVCGSVSNFTLHQRGGDKKFP